MKFTKYCFLLITMMCAYGATGYSQKHIATATVDERAELVSIVFRLAGSPEYCNCAVAKYREHIDRYFMDYKNHEVIQLAKDYRRDYGVSYDAVMYVSVHITISGSDIVLDERIFNKPLEGRWTEERLRLFVDKLSDFYKKTNFRNFFESHSNLYSVSEDRMNDILHNKMYYKWFNDFWGTEAVDNYNVIVSLASGCGNYGLKVIENDKKENIYAVIGVCATDSLDNPIFPLEGTLSLLVHEISHSYTTMYDKSLFRDAGKVIYPLIESKMIDNAYGNWDIVLEEAMVRAAVINYMYKDPVNSFNIDRQIQFEKSKGFFWIRDLVNTFEVYDNNRDKYPDMLSFTPRIVEYYNKLADKIQKEGFVLPKVEKTSIIDKSTLDASVNELIYTFNKPMMAQGYGFNPGRLGKETMPKLDKIEWIDDRNLKLTLNLESNKEYSIQLYTPAYTDTQGNYLYENVELWFRTEQR